MLNHFSSILEPDQIVQDDASLRDYGKDWLKDFTPDPLAILMPRTLEQVRSVVLVCSQHGIPLVPSGGRTGLSGGATATKKELVLSLSRLNKILGVNRISRTIRCEAGVVTQRVQEEAARNGLYFPVDFASKGSSQIGGNIATNAGGIRVIRYGNIRDWVLGLKVVTADGALLDLNGALFKNQAGYDLRSLFIGSEGTLGVIVEATLKLASPPSEVMRSICAVEDLSRILDVLTRIRDEVRGVSAFEFFTENALSKVLKHHGLRDPFRRRYPNYVLIEVEHAAHDSESLELSVGKLLEDGTVADAVISQGSQQAGELMALRELISETLSANHVLHKNDISVPIDAIPEFIRAMDKKVSDNYPGFEVVTFGHIGDGNLHVNILKPADMASDVFYDHCRKADHQLFTLVQSFKGSVSAEHGVGLLKKEFLGYTRAPEEIEYMKAIKRAFDPKNILNPGKVFDLSS